MSRSLSLTSLACLLLLAACAQPGIPGRGGLQGDGLARALAATTGPKLTFVANQDYMPALTELLDRPGIQTVDVLMFNFYADHGGDTQAILDKLIALKAKGAKIRVFLEGLRDEPKLRHQDTIKKLAAGGITDVKLSSANTVHAKSICVDGNTLLLGSTNWTVTSMGKNNETNARVESAKLGGAFTAFFNKLYAGAPTLMAGRTVDGDTALLTDTAYYDEALALIGRAKRSLDIGTYFLAYRVGREADDVKVKALLDAVIAQHDKVKKTGKPFAVRFFLDNNGINPEMHESHTIKGSWNARNYLVKAGIDEVFFDRYEQISHCKYLIKDGNPAAREGGTAEVLFGSTNLYVGDFDHNHQLNVLSSDAGLVKSFTAYMGTRLADSSKEIHKPAAGGRSGLKETWFESGDE